MKRLQKDNINSPDYMDHVWQLEQIHRYDVERLLALLSLVQPKEKVLELGAGRFSAIEYGLINMNLDIDAHAIDYSQVAVDMTLQICPTLKYIKGDIFNSPYKECDFDGVICAEVIEHMEKPDQLVAEMARLVKVKGWATLSTVNETCSDAQKRTYPDHIWSFTQDELKEMFDQWFDKVETGFIGNYRMVWARK